MGCLMGIRRWVGAFRELTFAAYWEGDCSMLNLVAGTPDRRTRRRPPSDRTCVHFFQQVNSARRAYFGGVLGPVEGRFSKPRRR